MSFNTDTFKKTCASPKVKKAALVGYRGLSSAAIVWLFATFASKDSVKTLWQKISAQQQQIQKLEVELAVERATSIHHGQLPNPHQP